MITPMPHGFSHAIKESSPSSSENLFSLSKNQFAKYIQRIRTVMENNSSIASVHLYSLLMEPYMRAYAFILHNKMELLSENTSIS